MTATVGVMRDWPHRYHVRLTLRSRAVVESDVVTWYDEAKAVAIAVSHHVRGRDDPMTEPVLVTVQHLGPVARAADGSTDIPGRDLVDRWEF